MASLIQSGGGQEVHGRRAREDVQPVRSGLRRHDLIGRGMIAALIGVAAGAAMLAYGNFGHPSAVEAETAQTLRIVAAPTDPEPRLATGLKAHTHEVPSAAVSLAAAAPLASPPAAAPAPGPQAIDPQLARDAAAAGMTAHIPSEAADFG